MRSLNQATIAIAHAHVVRLQIRFPLFACIETDTVKFKNFATLSDKRNDGKKHATHDYEAKDFQHPPSFIGLHHGLRRK
jgi:hypothetical protein